MEAVGPGYTSATRLADHYQVVRERLMGRRPSAGPGRPRAPSARCDETRAAGTLFTLGFMHGLVFAACLRAFEHAAPSGRQCSEPADTPELSILHQIVEGASRFYGVHVHDLSSPRMSPRIVKARQVAMYLMCVMTRTPLTAIGRLLGGRRHTTVLRARRGIERLVRSDPTVAAEIESLRRVIATGVGSPASARGDRR